MSLSNQTLHKDVEGHDQYHSAIRIHDGVWSADQMFLPRFKGPRFANPSPLAFAALAVSLYMISNVALGTKDLTSLAVVPATALGFSSVALLVAGIWNFPTGNTFGAALYTTLSGLFFSLTLLLSSWSGIATSYADDSAQFGTAVSQFMFAWFITLVIFTVAAHRSSGGLMIFLSLVDITVLFLALSYNYPAHATKLLTAAGSFGIVSSFVAWYATLASLLTAESSLFLLPVLGDFSSSRA